MLKRRVVIRHWLPIITFCPVNGLPDFVYASVTFDGEDIHELYDVRRRMRKAIRGKRMFMETLCNRLAREFPDATSAAIRLMFNRHEVTYAKHSNTQKGEE